MRLGKSSATLAALAILAGCSDGPAEPEAAAVGQNAAAAVVKDAAEPNGPEQLAEIPQAFRGQWDAAGEFSCTDLSSEIMRIEDNAILFYEAEARTTSIARIAASEIRANVDFQAIDENSKEIYTLKLSENGRKLDLVAEGLEPFSYRRCDAIKEAVLIPDPFIGRWVDALEDDCKAPKDRFVVVTRTGIARWGKNETLTKAEPVGNDAVELAVAEENDPFGLSVFDNGQRMMLSGPGYGGIPLRRCPG